MKKPAFGMNAGFFVCPHPNFGEWILYFYLKSTKAPYAFFIQALNTWIFYLFNSFF
ncbi:MAG: hypothetical protein KF763_07865 [Cyclobacteriaceae bacterium]|nr:hypothetical protein [Cyclobacteriaceae bacterium]